MPTLYRAVSTLYSNGEPVNASFTAAERCCHAARICILRNMSCIKPPGINNGRLLL